MKQDILRNQKGFTLIEIIAVLVILGLLAVVAVPKYIDLQDQAAEKSAEGVWGAANSAASLSFAQGILDPTNNTPISDGTTLLAEFESTPEGWSASGSTITATINGTTYTITVTAAEVEGTSRAVLTKSW
jgi:MSHA pilin protein MshA